MGARGREGEGEIASLLEYRCSMQMRRPFPGPEEAPSMDLEDLAMCILDRLATTPADRRGALMTRTASSTIT
jgi:hypothetical protein